MRAAKIGSLDAELCAGALTPLAWHRAFGGDGLYAALDGVESSLARTPPSVPLLDLLRLAWCEQWTADYAAGRETPPFERWCAEVGLFDTNDLAVAVVAEAHAGIFHRPRGGAAGGAD